MKGKPAKLYEFRGQQLRVDEIAALLGVSVTVVYRNISNGRALDRVGAKRCSGCGKAILVNTHCARCTANMNSVDGRKKKTFKAKHFENHIAIIAKATA